MPLNETAQKVKKKVSTSFKSAISRSKKGKKARKWRLTKNLSFLISSCTQANIFLWNWNSKENRKASRGIPKAAFSVCSHVMAQLKMRLCHRHSLLSLFFAFFYFLEQRSVHDFLPYIWTDLCGWAELSLSFCPFLCMKIGNFWTFLGHCPGETFSICKN